MPPAHIRPHRRILAELPEFGEPTIEPKISSATHASRVARARQRAKAAGFDALFVYADREHHANLTYLCGYDPRFEEAFLVIAPDRRPTLFVGNEGWGYCELAAGDFDRVLYQSLSLLGQPREKMRPLAALLAEAGLQPGMKIGAAGWKSFGVEDMADGRWLEIPSFLADALRALAGAEGGVGNANDIFMNPRDGMRAVNEAEQLAAFEFAATFASQSVRNVLFGLKPGMREIDAARLMQASGLPLGAHTMLAAGPRARYGLISPTLRPMELGEPFTMASCLQGALTCRAGFLARGAADLAPAVRDYVERLAGPYFSAVAAWYETLEIGAPAGDLQGAVQHLIDDPFFNIGLNPGHLIHLDEWMHSPVTQGSRIPLASGMALQMDIIPATGTDYFTANMEDGIALADAALRAEFSERFPEAWSRIVRRRAFMGDVLGIRLRPEVLPFSSIPAYFPPFLLSPREVLAVG